MITIKKPKNKDIINMRRNSILRMLNPLIAPFHAENVKKYNKAIQDEIEKYGYSFYDESDFEKYKNKLERLSVLTIARPRLPAHNFFVSVTIGSPSLITQETASSVLFKTRFKNIKACYYEEWQEEGDSFILQRMYLHLFFQGNRTEDPVQFLCVHSEPHYFNEKPKYSGLVHMHIGSDILSNMHILTSIVPKKEVFSNILDCEEIFERTILSICIELEREKMKLLQDIGPIRYLAE